MDNGLLSVGMLYRFGSTVNHDDVALTQHGLEPRITAHDAAATHRGKRNRSTTTFDLADPTADRPRARR